MTRAEQRANEFYPELNEQDDVAAWHGFIAGYEQAVKDMMKEAVEAEAEVCKLTERAWITPTDGKRFHQDVYDNFKAGDKVKIIIVKQ